VLLTAGLNTLRNCLSKCGPSYGEKTPLGASIDHKDSSGRSHGHIVTAVLVRRVPSQASDQDSKVETFFLFLPLFASVPAAPPKPAPPARSCESANCTKSPTPPAPPHVPTHARARKKVSKGFSYFGAFGAKTRTCRCAVGAAKRWIDRARSDLSISGIVVGVG